MAFSPFNYSNTSKASVAIAYHFKNAKPYFDFDPKIYLSQKLLLRFVKKETGLNRVAFELLCIIEASKEHTLPKYVMLQTFVNNGDVLNRNLEILTDKGYLKKEVKWKYRRRNAVYYSIMPHARELFRKCREFCLYELRYSF